MVSTAQPPPMKVSRQGLLLIKSFEGFRPQAVRRRDGVLVIGYGHSRTARPGVVISEADAELLLLYDLMPVIQVIRTHVRRPLNQHQFDALASFILSIGVDRFVRSEVLEHLESGAWDQAALALTREPDRVPPPVDLPYRRRSAERALFDTAPKESPDLARLLTAPVSSPVNGPYPGKTAHQPAAEPDGSADEERLVSSTISVMRHERTARRKPDHADIGALIFAGAIGLLAVTAGALALRRSLPDSQPGDGSMLIGGFLGIIGVALMATALWPLLGKRHDKGSI